MRSLKVLPVVLGIAMLAAPEGRAMAAETGALPDQNAPSQFDQQAGRRGDQTLSERLDRSDGVIRPPSRVDPQMHVTPPATGDKMPIVPAPGSPGGNPNVQPK
jgi:hypothetical protein